MSINSDENGIKEEDYDKNLLNRLIGHVKILKINFEFYKDKKLPDIKDQIKTLEVLAADLAKQGCDVNEASKILDRLKAEVHPITVNDDLNRVRFSLFYAPKRLWFSQTFCPYLLMLWQFIVIGLWAWLILSNSKDYMMFLENGNWTLLQTIYVSVISGSLGAASFATFGVYSHLIHRNMDSAFTGWYIARPLVGGVMGAFVGIIGSVALSSGNGAHIIAMGIAFLAGSNEQFAAKMIERFTTKVMGEAPKTTNHVVVSGSEASPIQKDTEAAKAQEQATAQAQKAQAVQVNAVDGKMNATLEELEPKVK